MKYKLLALDMDGTLLNSKKEVTAETQKALLEAIKQGVIVTACTGRPLQGLRQYSQLLSPDAAAATYNGAVVVTTETKKVLFSKTLRAEAALEIINRGLAKGVTMIAWADNTLYVSEDNDRTRLYGSLSGSKGVLMTDPAAIAERGIVKVIWIDEPERTARHLSDIENSPILKARAVISSPEFLEFIDEEVSKSEGLKIIAAHYGVSREEIIAVGDNYNDLDMIKYAGLGIAMGNAEEEILKAADYVTLSNEEDGVKKVIDEFILKG